MNDALRCAKNALFYIQSHGKENPAWHKILDWLHWWLISFQLLTNIVLWYIKNNTAWTARVDKLGEVNRLIYMNLVENRGGGT